MLMTVINSLILFFIVLGFMGVLFFECIKENKIDKNELAKEMKKGESNTSKKRAPKSKPQSISQKEPSFVNTKTIAPVSDAGAQTQIKDISSKANSGNAAKKANNSIDLQNRVEGVDVNKQQQNPFEKDTQKKKCPSCGTENDINASECSYCRTEF